MNARASIAQSVIEVYVRTVPSTLDARPIIVNPVQSSHSATLASVMSVARVVNIRNVRVVKCTYCVIIAIPRPNVDSICNVIHVIDRCAIY